MVEISVIVPNYNHGQFLKQRLESILTQTFQDFELIILDDCSTDDSREIIDLYRNHSKVKHIVYNETNSGSPFKQWKKGINLSLGKYIWIAESDDWCEPSLLQHLHKAIAHDQKCAISYCQSYCVDTNDHITWLSQHHQLEEMQYGADFVSEKLLYGNSIFNASMALWRKDLYKDVSPTFTTFKFCGDWLFWIELATMGNVHINGRILNYFRKHPDDVSGKSYKSGLNFIEELKIIDIMFNENLIDKYQYKMAYELKFKQYRKVKAGFDKSTRRTINHLFNHPLINKPSFLKRILSNIGL